MRILFLTSPHSDYGEALLLRGLATVLGDSHVDDYPSKVVYRGTPTITYQKGDVPHDPDHSGHTAAQPWIKPLTSPVHTASEVLGRLENGKYDLVVFGSRRPAVWKTWQFLMDTQHGHLPRTIMTDHEDDPMIRAESAVRIGSPVLFKRELFKAGLVLEGVEIHPLPFSCGWADLLPPWAVGGPGRSGAFLSCSLTHPARKTALEALDRLSAAEAPVRGINVHSAGMYQENLRRSAIGVAVRGLGVDTLRQWEIPFFGAALLTDSSILIPNDFQAGEDCFRYHDHSALDIHIRDLLSQPNLVRQVAQRGQQKLLTYHTPAARARYFLEIVRRFLK